MSDLQIYTEVAGTTTYATGERGTVTGFLRDLGQTVGVFVKSDETPAMWLVQVGARTGDRGQYHEVQAARQINRDEFDQLNGLDALRCDLGWAA